MQEQWDWDLQKVAFKSVDLRQWCEKTMGLNQAVWEQVVQAEIALNHHERGAPSELQLNEKIKAKLALGGNQRTQLDVQEQDEKGAHCLRYWVKLKKDGEKGVEIHSIELKGSTDRLRSLSSYSGAIHPNPGLYYQEYGLGGNIVKEHYVKNTQSNPDPNIGHQKIIVRNLNWDDQGVLVFDCAYEYRFDEPDPVIHSNRSVVWVPSWGLLEHWEQTAYGDSKEALEQLGEQPVSILNNGERIRLKDLHSLVSLKAWKKDNIARSGETPENRVCWGDVQGFDAWSGCGVARDPLTGQLIMTKEAEIKKIQEMVAHYELKAVVKETIKEQRKQEEKSRRVKL